MTNEKLTRHSVITKPGLPRPDDVDFFSSPCNLSVYMCGLEVFKVHVVSRTRGVIYGKIWPEQGNPKGSGHVLPYIPTNIIPFLTRIY